MATSADTSATMLLVSLDEMPLPEVRVYIGAMYAKSPGKILLKVGWHGDNSERRHHFPPVTIYVATAALHDVSTLLGPDGRRAVTTPHRICDYKVYFQSENPEAVVILGLWLGLWTTSDKTVRDSFNEVIQYKFRGTAGLIAECWKIAHRFRIELFKNYLTSAMVELAQDEFETLMEYTDLFINLGFICSTIVDAMVENVAFLFVDRDMDLEDMMHDWMRYTRLMNTGTSTVLLRDFLTDVVDLKGLKDRNLPYHPQDHMCWKWHMHRSMEERQACPDFGAEPDLVLDMSDDDDDDDDDDHGSNYERKLDPDNGEDDSDDDDDDGDDGDKNHGDNGDDNDGDGDSEYHSDDEAEEAEEAEHGEPNPRSNSGRNQPTSGEYWPGWAQAQMEGRRTQGS